ncbi:plastocyanin/azurin family copper-binding protein [Halorhabdus amylolytica]|uniref:plastocyanin/azurin family copper-binding protein n=1 Tax=Halorhabdus amylolytica TaxID=2559573 RepID=UPI0010A9AA47|nr:plastocyanin/azurin family copper-binding protein [Halorhabdus amylolytica]
MDRRAFLASAGALTVGLSGCLAFGKDEDYDVGMSDSRFLPAEYRVPSGTTVVWKNTSARAHTVTAYDASLPDGADYFASGGYDDEDAARDAWFESGGGAIYSGETYAHTFEQPGTYPYVCLPHESDGMDGVIVVESRATVTGE